MYATFTVLPHYQFGVFIRSRAMSCVFIVSPQWQQFVSTVMGRACIAEHSIIFKLTKLLTLHTFRCAILTIFFFTEFLTFSALQLVLRGEISSEKYFF